MELLGEPAIALARKFKHDPLYGIPQLDILF
jgi:hypothetical protein